MVRVQRGELKWQRKARQRKRRQSQPSEEESSRPYQPEKHEISHNSTMRSPLLGNQSSLDEQLPQTFRLESPKQQQEGNLEGLSTFQSIRSSINQNTLFGRQQEQQAIQNFLSSHNYTVLYVCGVAGTGKTTAVQAVLTRLNILYTLFNCISSPQSQKLLIKHIQNGTGTQQASNVLVVDECDRILDFALVVCCLRSQATPPKTIFICNRSCRQQLGNLRVCQLYFMPYSKEETFEIVVKKLGADAGLVPANIVNEAAFKSSMRGDFREAEKYISNWARQHFAEPQASIEPHHALGNPFRAILQAFLQSANEQIHRLILQAYKDQKQQAQFEKKHGRGRRCRCQKNTLQKLARQGSPWLSKPQSLIQVKKLEEAGVLALRQNSCLQHGVNVTLVQTRLSEELVTELIRQAQYRIN